MPIRRVCVIYWSAWHQRIRLRATCIRFGIRGKQLQFPSSIYKRTFSKHVIEDESVPRWRCFAGRSGLLNPINSDQAKSCAKDLLRHKEIVGRIKPPNAEKLKARVSL